MYELSPIVLGFIAFSLGLGFFLLTFVILRWIPKFQLKAKAPIQPPASLEIPPHNEAVLLIKPGGRVSYINQQARELFNVWEEEPNLESLARRTRPSEAFLTLCASEGQARFSLNGRFVEGVSYFAPSGFSNDNEDQAATLITIRRPKLAFESDSYLSTRHPEGETWKQIGQESVDSSTQALGIFTELSRSMAVSLDLETTLQTILESVERLLPSDLLEITIWESEYKHLVPYRLVGLAGEDRHLEKASERYYPDEGYSGFLIIHQEPLLVIDVNTFTTIRPSLDRQRYPFQSYLGIPLLIAGELVGTLELASLTPENYSEGDLDILKLISGQAAIALNNAILYKQELQRSVELAGLANLAQTVSAIHDPQDLYSRLIESLSPLMPVNVLGFLIYDENRRVLEGQVPFLGIHTNIIEWYQMIVQPGSELEMMWQTPETIVTSNAPEDSRLALLELHHLAQVSGIQHAVLAPLTSGGRMMGYILAANKHDGAPFDQYDLRFLAIVTGQTAPIIENATLVQQSRHRAQRAETLRRVASLINSTATLDETLKFSLLDLARLLKADAAAVLLLNENRGELRVHKESLFGISPPLANRIGRMPIDHLQFRSTVTDSKKQFVSGALQEEANSLPIYQSLANDLNIRSLINIPLIMGERGIGELILGSLRPHFFSDGDAQTTATAAGQLALAIERSAIYSQTDQKLRQRVEQLTALTRVSRELNTTLELPHLLQRVYDEALRTTHSDCGTILLFELDAQKLLSLPQSGESVTLPDHKIRLHFGDNPRAELHPLELLVLRGGESVIVDDFNAVNTGSENGSDQPPLYPAHEGIQSAMVIPIAYQGQVAGLIHLHAKAVGHFGESELEIGEALSIQAAIALGNADRYRDQLRRSELLNRRVETLSKLFEVSQVLQTDQPLEESLEAIAYAIQAATSFDTVLISIYDPEQDQLVRLTGAGISLPTLAELRAHPQPWESVNSLLRPEFCVGRAYYIPSDQTSIAPKDLHTNSSSQSNGSPLGDRNWQPEDIFFVPLFSTTAEPLGLVSVDAPQDNLRPDRTTVETLEIFSSQVALVIESQQKVKILQTQVDKIHSELELAQVAAQQAQSHLPTLLHKDIEQTLAIQNLSQRARRINAGLDIAEIVSTLDTWQQVFASLARETLTRMDFDVVLVAEPTVGGLNLTHALGSIPEDVNPKSLMGQRNPLRQCLQTGELLLVSNLHNDSRWGNTPLLNSLDTRSFLCMPICDLSNGQGMSGVILDSSDIKAEPKNTLAAVLAISRTPLAPFTPDDEQLYTLLARQVAIALQNLNLLHETNHRLREVNLLLDFSRQLGSLDPSSILQTLVDSVLHAIPASQGSMVAIWDAAHGVLVPKAASGYSNNQELMEIHYQSGEGVPGQVFEQKRALRLDEVDFARHYNLSPENLRRYRNATGGQFPVSCLAVPIISGASQVSETEMPTDDTRAIPWGILIVDSAQATAAFTDNDMAVITSLAQQTALTLENTRLYQASIQRSSQLQALTNVSTTITSSLQTQDLIATLLDQLQAIIPYDTGTLWLRQRSLSTRAGQSNADRMVISAARGFEDSDQRLGLTVDVQDSQLLNEMITTGTPTWVQNVTQDPRFRTLQVEDEISEELSGELTATAYERLSWLGVPLIASGEVIGVIALEKTEPNFYSPDDIQVATAYAGQAAIGLENAQLYQETVNRAVELDQHSQTLTILNRLSSELSGSLDASNILENAVREFQQIMPCTSVSVLLTEYHSISSEVQPSTKEEEIAGGQIFVHNEYPLDDLDAGEGFGTGTAITNIDLFQRLQETQGIFTTDDVSKESELEPLKEHLARHNTHSLLIVPIISGSLIDDGPLTEQQFHGMFLAHNNQAHRFDSEEVELARTISNQVAIALQNARLTESLELRVQQRTAELEREHHRAETLLRIITELSATLDLDQVLHSTLQVLSEYVDAEQITILIARPGEKKLHRLASVGYTPEAGDQGSPTPLDINQGLAGWIIHQRQSALVEDVLQDDRWVQLPEHDQKDQTAQQHRSAMGVPLMSGAEALGCLLLYHPEVNHFSVDHLDLVQAAAKQVGVAVNNAELYRLIRDQAEDLGSMLRSQQIETSRSKAILEAVADGVLVTDASRQITLFNESAEKILGLERTQVLEKSMAHFSGLFGRGTQNWMETIQNWSNDPASYQYGDIYAEQITLEDGRVISVHLAPVSLRNDFLGTVSIFQDITHQVEVDRLKSEFVATVSHELRTPMTSIKGYVEVLLMGAAGELNTKQENFLQIVKSNTERLAILVNDLLDISQIESGRIALSKQPLNLEDIADRAISDLVSRTEGDDKEISVEKEVQPGLPRVIADSDRILRVFENLLDNAYQYNSSGGRIIVRLHQQGEEVQVDIQDSGAGIHSDDQPRVFERFYRGENPLVLGVSGTGLGLSIVQNLVEMHSGRIWLESTGNPGEGSTFSFTLPVYNPEKNNG